MYKSQIFELGERKENNFKIKYWAVTEKNKDAWKDPSVQFSLATQSCLTLCDHKDCGMPGFPIHHQLPELT